MLVCEDSLCPRKQPDVSRPSLGEAEHYRIISSLTACCRRARVGRLGHVGSLGCGEKEGERRKERAGGKKKKEAGWAELGWCGSEREESGWAARRKETGLAGFGFWAGFLFFSISFSFPISN